MLLWLHFKNRRLFKKKKQELCIKKENLAIVLCSELLLMFQVMAYHLSILNIVWSKTYTEGVEEG